MKNSTGVDLKIPPVDLLAKDFKEKVDAHKTPRSRASEIEYAIRHHININLVQDPIYYRSLSERLEEILKQHEDKWDLLEQELMEMRENIEVSREESAAQVGLSSTESPFYNILEHEIKNITGQDALDDSTQEEVIEVVKKLVQMMEDASSIVDFFNKEDEIRSARRDIRRTIMMTSFDDENLRKIIMDEFMELAKVKFQ